MPVMLEDGDDEKSAESAECEFTGYVVGVVVFRCLRYQPEFFMVCLSKQVSTRCEAV